MGVKYLNLYPLHLARMKIYTEYYGGNSNSGVSDTILSLHSYDVGWYGGNNDELAYNDDANGTLFSEIIFNMDEPMGGGYDAYYIKLSGYGSKSVHARIKVVQIPTRFIKMNENAPRDISLKTLEAGFYAFTPTRTDEYRLFTRPYGGGNENSDTMLYLYEDEWLTQLIDFNDDCREEDYYNFSAIKLKLTAGKTYYVALRAYETGIFHARFTIVGDNVNSEPCDSICQSFTTVQENVPEDIDKEESDEEALFKFTPSLTDEYRLFTSPYEGGDEFNDTAIVLFDDEELTHGIGYDDDGGQSAFSSITINLVASKTYYIIVRNVEGYPLHSRFTLVRRNLCGSQSNDPECKVPAVPSELRVTEIISNNSVWLNWNAPTDHAGVWGYDIYQGSTIVNSTNGEWMTTSASLIRNLLPNITYTFTVKARTRTGLVSEASNAVSVLINDTQPPTIPTDLRIMASTSNSVSLSWGASSDNVGVTGYNIYQGVNLVGSTWNATATNYTVTGLMPNTPYTFTIRAKDAAGNLSGASNTVSFNYQIDIQPPTTPSNLRVTNSTSNSATLSWGTSTDNVGVVGYDIYQGEALVGTVDGTITSYTATGLNPFTTYIFIVKARDAAGNVSAASNAVTVQIDIQPPTAPSNLQVSISTLSSVTLSWGASTDNIGVIGYDIYQGTTLIGSVNGTMTSYTAQNLLPNTSYSFIVRAKDAAGNVSEGSNTVNILIDTQEPTAPTNLRVLGNTSNSITLTWGTSTDNVGVVGYNIYQGVQLISTTLNGLTTSFTVPNLSPNTWYSFTVRAIDAAGNRSDASNVINAIIDTLPPTAPSNLQIAGSTSSSVTISWGESNDNVEVIVYDIYQGFDIHGSVSGKITSYTVQGITAGNIYTLSVKAKDAAGNVSAASNPATIRSVQQKRLRRLLWGMGTPLPLISQLMQ